MFTPQQKIDRKHKPLVPLPRFKDLEVGIQREIPQTLEATTYHQAQLTWDPQYPRDNIPCTTRSPIADLADHSQVAQKVLERDYAR